MSLVSSAWNWNQLELHLIWALPFTKVCNLGYLLILSIFLSTISPSPLLVTLASQFLDRHTSNDFFPTPLQPPIPIVITLTKSSSINTSSSKSQLQAFYLLITILNTSVQPF